MNRAFGHRSPAVTAITVGLVLGACTATSSPSTGTTGGGGAGGGGSKAASIDACKLLSPDEIKAQLNVTVDNGLLQTTDSQASCDWNSSDANGAGVGIIVQDFDQSLWDALSSAQYAKPVSGIGDGAFAGEPAAGNLNIKLGNYEVDVAVVDFKMTNDQEAAASLALAKLVLPRVH